jgi:hypothetical protein
MPPKNANPVQIKRYNFGDYSKTKQSKHHGMSMLHTERWILDTSVISVADSLPLLENSSLGKAVNLSSGAGLLSSENKDITTITPQTSIMTLISCAKAPA